ncbi:hypothetical protein A2634_04735 [Candidatus Amesbacteria bacterium RIFCSPHIGHO2_01_FULL_48_32]|uniref:Amine oxidase domain-containing protein n=1 Tax=Candidatus Amesbacteria bacterium RIFCSPLOWO2_01_FULL_48_25 TaxID=1797259 RepID=A0A1F4ZCC1_9BACT|nr:MAG: hypothetical protein A2634_04735 [Candidatus Amesbacteria bacterium RIFCSPHIGHO2_01_FULL_48_32]OGD03457.1 MAG: hypothetical protein A2989_02405 [Candidatus Amesbacteria bacterium RIFCSPLOWO2_01_FULL_48_25]HJZ05762.1 NAD(P)/FAD-dependent oxidoreductase [Patescibacteria group bacterium]
MGTQKKQLKICIIGAGFTGLAAAYYLSKAGHLVEVFEKESQPGGLAIGFQDPNWEWPLEQHYHHWFESDWAIRNLATEIGHSVTFTRPVTSTWINGRISQLDSPISLLKFSHLSMEARLRTAVGLAGLRFNPFWQPFEYFTAKSYIRAIMGEASWKDLWEPLFVGKFDKYAGDISAAWLWARIYKRSPTLGYPEGGFLSFAKSLELAAINYGAKFYYHHPVSHINELLPQFDKVICTLPTPLFEKISGLTYPKLEGIGAVNLVLALKHQFLTDGSYWLNINDRKMPFLAVVEHTNFIEPKHYGGEHLLYVGNYLPSNHEFFRLSENDLVQKFLPYLKMISPKFTQSWIRKSWAFKAPFAQPIITKNYSQLIPPLSTSISNLYLANIQQVYPWDRGTNYAVELGRQVADLCLKK